MRVCTYSTVRQVINGGKAVVDDKRITPELRTEAARLTNEYMDKVDDAGIAWCDFYEVFRREKRRKEDSGPRDAFERALQVCIREKV